MRLGACTLNATSSLPSQLTLPGSRPAGGPSFCTYFSSSWSLGCGVNAYVDQASSGHEVEGFRSFTEI